MSAGVVRRGDVVWVDLSQFGGRLSKRRPAVVVQNDVANARSPETIVVAVRDAVSSKTLPVFVEVEPGIAGLTKRSVIDAGHVQTVRKDALGPALGRLPENVLQRLDSALAVSLGLRLP